MGQQEYSPVYFVGVTVYLGLFDEKSDKFRASLDITISHQIIHDTLSHQQNKPVNISLISVLHRFKYALFPVFLSFIKYFSFNQIKQCILTNGLGVKYLMMCEETQKFLTAT